ncbi:MAG TPA: diguanylate cyclase [Pyrinomonadaceae bacterium]|jgi:diguanylate cyclase (GGDEF)-like protein
MMDEQSAPEREDSIAQVGGRRPPEGWPALQDSLAADTGLSILLVEGHQPPAPAISNNNSICHAFQSSPEHVQLCDPYCGVAFERAVAQQGPVHYRCHAGLHCVALPVPLERKRQLAVITGRAFLTTADYRELCERFREGDLQELLSAELFQNVIFAARPDLDDLARRVLQEAEDYRESAPPADEEPQTPVSQSEEDEVAQPARDKETGAQFSPFDSGIFTPDATLDEACESVLKIICEDHKLSSAALLLLDDEKFACASAVGDLRNRPLHLQIERKDPRLIKAAGKGLPLVVYESAEGFIPLPSRGQKKGVRLAEAYPLVIGDEVKGALVVADDHLSDEMRQLISHACRRIAFPLEVIRLKEELERSETFADRIQLFTENVTTSEPAEAYRSILRHSTELLGAERGSLLVFDEMSNELTVKAAVGTRAEVLSETRVQLGEGVSGTVFQEGRPLLVRDLHTAGVSPAPAERCYKTKSFISYPITIAGRKVGVLNVTDKTEGSYSDVDLSLLESIAPQMALALDRAEWQEKATQFQLMSITDPLTGMLNRRYLEERLTEELNRSRRYEHPMSFMMIDIDDFKHYNDRNHHQAGDLALEMTAQCLKSALRSADVASRYGGEEFCILLPQTSLSEARIIAERIRRRVERTRYPHGKHQPLGALTVSIGISSLGPGLDTPETIIRAADRALYFAKERGKNRVEAFEDAPPETPYNDGSEEVK